LLRELEHYAAPWRGGEVTSWVAMRRPKKQRDAPSRFRPGTRGRSIVRRKRNPRRITPAPAADPPLTTTTAMTGSPPHLRDNPAMDTQVHHDDALIVAGKTYRSRLLTGTGKFRDLEETRVATEAAGSEIVTVAIRRTNIGQDPNEPNLL